MARRVTVAGIDADDVAAAVGAETVARGREYVRSGAVMTSSWRDVDHTLRGLVGGSRGRTYVVTLLFRPLPYGGLELAHGDCTCPVGEMCRHVAAVALSAAGEPPRADGPPDAASWEDALEMLLPAEAPAPVGGTGELALELTPAGGRLTARLLRPGAKGWVNGGLVWNRLQRAAADVDHRPEHLAVVRELYGLLQTCRSARAGFSPYGYYGYGGEERAVDLSEISSPRLWPLLDEAARVGLTLRHAAGRLGALEPYGHAELSLDVTAAPDEGAVTLRPLLRFAGQDAPDPDAEPVAFLGGELAHGVVCLSRAEGAAPAAARLRLARLEPPVAAPIQRAALAGSAVTVPADGLDRFRERFGTRLARLRGVTSSDASFTPPRTGPPVLVLRAAFSGEHALALAWQWSYDVGGTDVRAGTGPVTPGQEYRDTRAEGAVLTGLAELPVEWARHGLGTPPALTGTRLVGLGTAAFATEALPLLEHSDLVRVERSGDAADYREVGDALAIGVSTTESDVGTDWFDLGVSITVEGREIAFEPVFRALALGESHLLLADGAWFSLEKPELAALRALIEEARTLQDAAPSDPLRLSRYQAGWWEELSALGVVEHQADAWRAQVDGLLAAGSLDPAPVPATLEAELRPYQREGFEWLAFLWRHGLGGVLADDMGLGKTVQALALICHVRAADPGAGPVLIVAPTSVVPNWVREAERFAPHLSVVALTDTLAKRGSDLDELVTGADVVVTSYTLFRLDADAHEATAWSGVLYDEAQFLKNRRSKVYQCARRVPAPFRLAITGTPMENDLMELWALLSVTAPGLFPNPLTFRESYARPIERGEDPELLATLRRRVRPLMLRRTKEQVAPELPEKQQQVLPVELAPAHRRLYERHLQRERQRILGLLDDVDGNRLLILASLTRLRRLALHPAFVDDGDPAAGSAKLDVLVSQLHDVVGGGHRALVFSQFTGFLAKVREALDAAGIAYAYLDGTTTRRGEVVAGFKDGDAPVFLISLKAGGFGLNLTEADYCFLLDPWWNPATEAQAIDRTHRIGQTRTVMVYRLIAQHTIEEKVRALAERKAELFAGVMDDGAAFASSLDADDIRSLVS